MNGDNIQAKHRKIKVIEQELANFEVQKGINCRILVIEGKKSLDIRRYYKNYPTKRGIRLSDEGTKLLLNKLSELIN